MKNWAKTYKAQTDGFHLTIERIDSKPIRATWDTIQQIKDEMLGSDVFAIEIYPPHAQIVNEVNRRHFWAVDECEVDRFNMWKRR